MNCCHKSRFYIKIIINNFAIGAKQFVVHEAFDIISCFFSNSLSLTPNTTVISALLAGADIKTFTLPLRCFLASSALVKIPYILKQYQFHDLSGTSLEPFIIKFYFLSQYLLFGLQN